MQVHILLFGALKDVPRETGSRQMETHMETIDLPDGATVAEFLRLWMEKFPEMRRFAGSLAVAVNREYALPTHPLHEGDEVALLPPVSGGCAADRLLDATLPSD
ncbi:MAG: MoaD/ThiS family protein, partial [Acidobacteriaceae bacterium]